MRTRRPGQEDIMSEVDAAFPEREASGYNCAIIRAAQRESHIVSQAVAGVKPSLPWRQMLLRHARLGHQNAISHPAPADIWLIWSKAIRNAKSFNWKHLYLFDFIFLSPFLFLASMIIKKGRYHNLTFHLLVYLLTILSTFKNHARDIRQK